MKENEFQAKLIELLKKRNARVVNFVGSQFMESGIADLRVTHTYWKGWIELKVDKNTLQPEQARFLKDHADRGDNCLAVWYFNEDGSIYVWGRTGNNPGKEFHCDSIEQFVALLLRKRGDQHATKHTEPDASTTTIGEGSRSSVSDRGAVEGSGETEQSV